MVLEMRGHSIIPIDNELVTEAISVIFLIGSAVASWWKNNSFTKEAIEADNYLKTLKEVNKEEA
jgi:SPP1 family holin